ncbi:hypothetical protein VARIO8X_60029 [Burkholderiales bacterium 8X]|nr:hypothetical protein VARIO8X_60029 [Burkholderiales bacterium 8X]
MPVVASRAPSTAGMASASAAIARAGRDGVLLDLGNARAEFESSMFFKIVSVFLCGRRS